jgi:hypothetical protein
VAAGAYQGNRPPEYIDSWKGGGHGPEDGEEGLECVRGVRCVAWLLVEVEEQQAEGRLCPEVIYAFVTGFESESPKAGLVGVALFVLCPVGVAGPVAAAAAKTVVDLRKCFAGAVLLEHWEMTVHGKAIELTSGRWKEIW